MKSTNTKLCSIKQTKSNKLILNYSYKQVDFQKLRLNSKKIYPL